MRSIISRKLLTAAAATGILSLTGGFAVAANSASGTGDFPAADAGQYVQVPLPANMWDDPDGYGDGPDDETPKPPTYPPTSPPTTKPPTYP
ncbi:hypothetical protein J7E93_04730, partial [Streptomyces sp. ISL-36]|nr:hypothetical protein [Streptomyces sp. ISL-36]